jgi:hypothetical protein
VVAIGIFKTHQSNREMRASQLRGGRQLTSGNLEQQDLLSFASL